MSMVSRGPSRETAPGSSTSRPGSADVPAPARLRTVHVVLPAYNEEKSLPPLLGRLAAADHRTRDQHALKAWVVDDGSSDGTAQVTRDHDSDLDVTLVEHGINRGLGEAVMSGVFAALEVADDDDMIVVMDADDTHDVATIEAMETEIDRGADIVIASRYVAGGDDATAPPFRRLLSRGAAIVFRVALPLDNIHDFTSGFRAYRAGLLRRAVRHWGQRLIEEEGFACMVELLLKLRHGNPVMAEVPLVLRYDRKQSASKLKLGRTLLQYLKLLGRDRLTPPPRRGL
jgi:dolichol-phosphate mannosyltransferase